MGDGQVSRDEGRWEAVYEDEEVVSEEEEVVGEEEEVVEEDEEVVEEPDEEVVAKPEPVLETRMTTTELFLLHVYEAKRYYNMYLEAKKRGMTELEKRFHTESKRHLREAFHLCPYRPHYCPIYALTVSKCPVNLEKRCRPLALSVNRPKKIRGWFQGRKR